MLRVDFFGRDQTFVDLDPSETFGAVPLKSQSC